jgi:protease-4
VLPYSFNCYLKRFGKFCFVGVLEKVGIEPQVERIGKYKSAGDQLIRKTMSEENCEMLTALLDNIYGNWLDKVSSAKGGLASDASLNLQVLNKLTGFCKFSAGKSREDLENFINEGVYQVERIKEEGWITNISYDDEVHSSVPVCLEVRA